MQRRLNNLERLYKKFLARYGEDDSLVLELKRELDACALIASRSDGRHKLASKVSYAHTMTPDTQSMTA
jgi:hypothetical protein